MGQRERLLQLTSLTVVPLVSIFSKSFEYIKTVKEAVRINPPLYMEEAGQVVQTIFIPQEPLRCNVFQCPTSVPLVVVHLWKTS